MKCSRLSRKAGKGCKQHDKIFSDNRYALYAAVDLRVKEQKVSKREMFPFGDHMLKCGNIMFLVKNSMSQEY